MKHAVFLIDLNQDVAACRHVAHFIRRESSLAILFIVTKNFRRRDATGVWFLEIQEIVQELDAELVEVGSVAEAVRRLHQKAGLLFSASESALDAHLFNHHTFLAAPEGFVRVTLQHGLECIGFNHNDAHDRTWRHYVGMACDVAASWFESDALHSVRADQQKKVLAVGPPLGLESAPPACRPRRAATGMPVVHGLVCENLHSVRFSAGDRTHFVKALSSFAQKLEPLGGTIELRPHPGGLYLERNKVRLPANVRINRLPLYRQSLEKFGFCISGPSTVLFDLVWANVPVAVWTSGDDKMATGVYANLHTVSDEADWLEFSVAATSDPAPFLASQAKFLASLRMPPDIPSRYRELLKLVAD